MADEADGNVPAVEQEPKIIQNSEGLSQSPRLGEAIEAHDLVDPEAQSPSHVENSIDASPMGDSNREVHEEEDKRADELLDQELEGEMSPEPRHEAPAEKFFTPTNPLIEWVKSKIELDDYNPEMWKNDYNENVDNFLNQEEENALYFWVSENEGLQMDFLGPPEYSKESSGFTYFIKPGSLPEKITLNNITKLVIFGTVDKGPLDVLLEYMNGFVNIIKREQKWPESVKKEFLGSLHSFIGNITEASHQQKGSTILYIPNEDITDPELAAKDKDLVQRLESTLIRWTRQIRDVVNNQDSQQENENAGPLDEIHHWKLRTGNLSRINDQLVKPELQRVLKVLEKADSSYLKRFDELASQIGQGAKEAENNLLHLETLIEPCKLLGQTRPRDIEKLIPDLLNKVLAIWKNSLYYNTSERITGLFRKISNEIINRCISIIDIQDMLGNEVNKCKADLKESQQCGITWKKIFEGTIEKSGEENYNKGSIFSQVDAFVQRCVDLKQICKGQLQFARKDIENQALPHFGGTRGREITENIREIERSFNKQIDRIRTLDYNILDVKITHWHTDYNKFKLKMKHLENMYKNIIEFAFQGVTNVYQGVEMLEAFDSLAKRKPIKQHVQKKAAFVYDKFREDLDLVKKEYDNRNEAPVATYHPRGGGSALWFRALIGRIQKQKAKLDLLTFIEEETALKRKEEVYKKYEETHDRLKSYIITTRNLWDEDIKKMSQDGLHTVMKRRVFTKEDEGTTTSAAIPGLESKILKKTKQGSLSSDFDKDLMRLVAEVKCWEKLQPFGINIPSEVHEVTSFREEFRIIKENVLLVVKDYNNIMCVLDEDEKRLFDLHINYLNTKLKPGWTKVIDWNKKQIVETTIKDWRRQCTECLDKVYLYKSNTERLYAKCEELALISLLSLNRKQVYEIEEFEKKQNEHLESINPQLQTLCDEMMHIVMTTYDIFNSGDLKFQSATQSMEIVQSQWQIYLQQIDKKLEESLKRAVKHALNEMNKAINGDSKSEPAPVFYLHVTLDEQKQKTDFRPSRDSMKEMIYRVLNKIIDINKSVYKISERFIQQRSLTNQKFDKAPVLALTLSNPSNAGLKVENPPREEDEKCVPNFRKDKEINGVMKRISRGLEKCNTYLDESLQTWKREHYTKVWEKSKTLFLKRKKDQRPDASSFEEDIKHYHSVIGEVSNERNSVAVLFVMVDNTEIQSTIKKFCMDWINSTTDLVNEIAREELNGIYELFRTSKDQLTTDPVDIFHLKRSQDKLQEMQSKIFEIDRDIPPIEKKYALLKDNDVQYPPDELAKLNELPTKFDEWKDMLQSSQLKLDRSNKEFEKEVSKSWKDYQKAVEESHNEFKQEAPFSVENTNTNEAKKKVTEFRNRVIALKEREENMQFGIKLFKMQVYALEDISEMDRDLELLDEIWDLKTKWDVQWETWKTTRFYDLKVEVMTEIGNGFIERLKELEKSMKQWGVWNHLSNSLNIFLNTMPLLRQLSHKAIQDRHWDELKWEIKQQFNQHDSEFTMETIWQLGLHQYTDYISDLFTRAQQQLGIYETINSIAKAWESLELEVIPYKDNYFKLRSTDAIFQSLEENIISLSSMKSQVHSEPFHEDIAHWEFCLSQINDTIEVLLMVQRQWLYLESIFVGKDQEEFSKKQLSSERSDFMRANDRFMEEMKRIENNPNALKALCHPGFYDTLIELNTLLDKVKKGLDQFLSMERSKFPRFYFLSDDDLLNILGQGKNPKEIQHHVKKLFEGIKQLEMYETFKRPEAGERGGRGHKVHEIGGMIAADGEVIKLNPKVTAEGEVEQWLDQLEKSMQNTLKKLLVEAHKKTASKEKRAWIQGPWGGQLVITSGQIKWTLETRGNLIKFQNDSEKKKNPLKDQLRNQRKYVSRLVDYVREPSSEIERNRLVALITIEQHAREVLVKLIDKNVSNPNDFEWMQQLRFDKEDKMDMDSWICTVNQTNTSFEYGYEYQGNNGRLVVTPLTDRCYMTLTTALHMKRGGAPQGPAGTGKTETVKDLGKNIAKFVIVINCSESLDFSSLGRLFSGFAQSGAWGCLDEFNRIEVEVLSVVAQQISKIQIAIKENKKQFMFEGSTISLNPSCGIFVTMNPNYAGRSDLPDNLKSLFRPISMMYADLQLISEIMLLSEGFDKGGMLSKKMVTLYSLMVQQLSKQDHYDFGMRALKSVLTLAGGVKRENPTLDEELLLMKALYDMNIPKLVTEDVDLFLALLRGTFAGIELPENESNLLKIEIIAELERKGLQTTEMVMRKCMQLNDSLKTRHGNMLVGQALSGKSTTWKTLKAAVGVLARKGTAGFINIRTRILNPKSITVKEIYGWYDTSNEWHDGILSSIMKQICEEEGSEHKWFILDGPVDTKWIESMNSVLDDNKLLTLVNGDRIALPPNVRLLFEVENLAVASPATVSRAGMIYLDVKEQGYMPYYKSWVQKKDPDTANFLMEMFTKYAIKVIDTKKTCQEPVSITLINSVMSLTNVYDAFASGADLEKGEDAYWMLLEKWFVFSMIWSIGGSVDEAGRDAIDTCVRDIESGFPHSGILYDYYVSNEKKEWMPWSERISQKPSINPGTPFSKILVTTIDTYRSLEVMKGLVKNKTHVLAVGSTGTGKTALITTGLLGTLDETAYTYFSINFSGQTSSEKTQDIIENSLEKSISNKRGPPANKRCVMFVDDLNMPRKDEYGSQPPLELLRAWADYGYWYDRKKQMPLFILDLQMVAAMGPPGGGRAEISQRFQCHFTTLNFTNPDDNQMRRIYYTIISHHLSDFDEEVKSLAEVFTNATISLYHRIKDTFLPTPTKSHYVFNMRDVSRVFQGMYKADKNYHDSKDSLVKLWVHECLRIFHDRMINMDDQNLIKQVLDEQLQAGMGMSYQQCCITMQVGDKTIQVDPLFIGEDLRTDGGKVYDLIESYDQLKTCLEDKLNNYNNVQGNLHMNLVLFREAITYLCKIHRILKQESGHALLVGVGGSGRHSLSRLAAFSANYELIQLELNKNYKLAEFREDIKKIKARAGLQNKPIVFMFSDNDVVDELFLEDVNNILSSGEVPNIYTNDELKDIRENMKKPLKMLKRNETPDALYGLFLERVRQNLHVCFCISPVGSKFRDYCRVYPGLINNTTINWFMPWPAEALYEVATKYTKEELDFDETLKSNICDVFSFMHITVTENTQKMLTELKRPYYVTPTHYLDIVTGFVELLKSKQKQIGDSAKKLKNGLGKLEEAKSQVEKMSKELEVTKNEVSKKQQQCEDLMTQINQEQTKADRSQKEMEHKRDEIEKEKKGVEALALEAQIDLDKATPALLEAEQALEKLEKKDLAEIRSYAAPPPAVEKVMNAVMIILINEKPNWQNTKKELNDPNFMSRIKNYNKDEIPNKTLKKLEAYTQLPEFSPKVLEGISIAAMALCKWVHALEAYGKTFRDVEPKRQTVKALENNLKKMEEKLTELAENLRLVTEAIQELDKQLKAQEDERKLYEDQAKELQIKLERAEKLVSGLGSERIRWEASLVRFEEIFTKLPGGCLISAGFLAYNGPFTSHYREDLVDKKWVPLVKHKKIPIMPEFTFTEFMSSPTEVRDWNLKKLPTDKFSIENAILCLRSKRWPLMIDPQHQANTWIKRLEPDIKIVNPQKKYMAIMEEAIRKGFAVLLEDIEEEIDPSLDPVLKKSIQKRGKLLTIKLGEKEISYNMNFRLYLTTRMSNPHYTPEISTKLTIVNFQVKESGLEEQLLGILVSEEDPKLETDKNNSVLSIAHKNKELVEKEDEILSRLSNSTGSLLDDENLINTLHSIKETGEKLKQDLESSESNIRKLDGLRENYRPCATKASVLYFVLANLNYVDPMYQFSLESYVELFKDSIIKSKEKNVVWDSIPERIGHLDKYHMFAVYSSTCRALFEKHKLLLSLMMCVDLSKMEGSINMQEYSFFLHGGIVIGEVERAANPDPEWITPEMWDNITELERTIPTFQGIEGSMIVSRKEWKRWFQTPEPENEHLPGEWDAKADDLRRIVLLRCLRSDRVLFAVADYVSKKLGPEYIESPPFILEDLYKDYSKPTQPILFVLSPGVDPAPQLTLLSQEKGKDIEIIPLGKGQDIKAQKALTEAAEKGFWVFLANCHLAISWMSALEEQIEMLIRKNLHEDFRLWLSSDPHPKFPISVLQRCVKVTTEPPKGIRPNMLRLYNQITEKHYSRVSEPIKYRKLLFTLCWFHAILVERKKFKSLGWNTIYSFNDSDWEVSENILAKYLGFKEEGDKMDVDPKNIPWDAIRYLIAEVSYGGRVTDDRDRRLLMVYAEECFNPKIIEELKYKLIENTQIYYIPDDTNYKPPQENPNPAVFYIKFIKAFPPIDRPEAFGQHVNAQIASQITDTRELLDAILELTPQVSVAGGESMDSKVLMICADMLEKIPEPLNLEEIKIKWQRDPSPLKVVLVQEIARYNRLLNFTRSSVAMLSKGIQGLVVISEELEKVMISLSLNKIPSSWQFAYPSLKPLAAWVRDLQQRIKQLKTWAYGQAPVVYWISGFTYPTGFTTALLQQTAASKPCSIDSLSMDYIILQEEENIIPPKEGAYISGLFLEGAKWNGEAQCLCEPEPMELFWPMPSIHFKPVKDKKKPKANIYSSPCYYYPVREGARERPSFMFHVDLKSGDFPPEYWIKRGTALLLSIDS